MPLSELLDKKLVVFCGKGGVGKTTIASSFSVGASDEGRKTLIVSIDPAHSLSDCFGVKLDHTIRNVKDNLDAVELESRVQFWEQLKDFKNEVGLTDKEFPIPKNWREVKIGVGQNESHAFMAISDLLLSSSLSKEYDLFIIDTAPTGHTLKLLGLTKYFSTYQGRVELRSWKRGDAWRKMTKRKSNPHAYKLRVDNTLKNLMNYFSNPELTCFIPVFIPTEMAINETLRLIEELFDIFTNYRSLLDGEDYDFIAPFDPMFMAAKVHFGRFDLLNGATVGELINEIIEDKNKKEPRKYFILNMMSGGEEDGILESFGFPGRCSCTYCDSKKRDAEKNLKYFIENFNELSDNHELIRVPYFPREVKGINMLRTCYKVLSGEV